MVVRLRLARHGTKNNPFYHLVAITDKKPRDARPIEKLGEYDPIPRPVPVSSPSSSSSSSSSSSLKVPPPPAGLSRPPLQPGGKGKARDAPEGYGRLVSSGLGVETEMRKRIEWNAERIRYWLANGAQPSKPVARLLDRAGLIPDGKFYKGMFRPPSPDTAASPTSTPASPVVTNAILEAVGATPSAPPDSPAAAASRAAQHRDRAATPPALSGESTMDQAQ